MIIYAPDRQLGQLSRRRLAGRRRRLSLTLRPVACPEAARRMKFNYWAELQVCRKGSLGSPPGRPI